MSTFLQRSPAFLSATPATREWTGHRTFDTSVHFRTVQFRSGSPPLRQMEPHIEETRMSRTTPRRGGGWFASRPVGAKIGAAVGLLAVVVLGTNALAVQRISALRDHQETI